MRPRDTYDIVSYIALPGILAGLLSITFNLMRLCT